MKLNILGKDYYIPLNSLNVSRKMEFRILSQYLNVEPRDLLCDIGCGDGYWTKQFAGLEKCRISGIDLNLDRLKHARINRHTAGLFLKGDVQVLPYKSGIFDKIVSICVLEHLENDVMALEEMRRVIKANGILAMSVDSFSYPNLSEEMKKDHQVKYQVVNYYTYEELKKKLLRSGFRILDYRFITNSALSKFFYEYYIWRRKLGYLLYPLAYPLSIVSDRVWGSRTYGFKLAIKAQAV